MPIDINALKTKVVSLMVADTILISILAKDPLAPTQPMVIEGTFNEMTDSLSVGGVTKNVYPCITYQIGNVKSDNRIFEVPALDPGDAPIMPEIDYVTLSIDAWNSQPDSFNLGAIAGELDMLFHQRTFAFVGGTVFRSQRVSQIIVPFDKLTNAWCYCSIFRLFVSTPPPS